MIKVTTPARTSEEHTIETASYTSQGGYWTEGEAYEISSREAESFRTAASRLAPIYDDAMEVVTTDDKYADHFVITGRKKDDRKIYEFACDQWKKRKSNAYILDRWDLAWDGQTPPKLLERNFGYLGLITGTASVQEDYIHWLSKQNGYSEIRPFGSLQSSFINAFRHAAEEFGVPGNSRIAVIAEAARETSDKGMIRAGEIVCQWIRRAGYEPVQINATLMYHDIGDIKVDIPLPENIQKKWQSDLDHRGYIEDGSATIGLKQKYCYPFAYSQYYAHTRAIDGFDPALEPDEFRRSLGSRNAYTDKPTVQMMFPFWSLLLGHKAMLPILFERHPKHPNLLPAYFSGEPLAGTKYVVKAANGYQGIGSKIISESGKIIATRHFRRGKPPYSHICQKYTSGCEEPDGGFRVFHMFTTNGIAAALGARVAPDTFVGGSDTKTKYMPVFVRGENRRQNKVEDSPSL